LNELAIQKNHCPAGVTKVEKTKRCLDAHLSSKARNFWEKKGKKGASGPGVQVIARCGTTQGLLRGTQKIRLTTGKRGKKVVKRKKDDWSPKEKGQARQAADRLDPRQGKVTFTPVQELSSGLRRQGGILGKKGELKNAPAVRNDS